MNTLIISGHQIHLLSKSPGVLFGLLMAPILMIYLFGLVFGSLIYDPASGLNATDYFGSTLLSLGILQGTFIASWGVGKEERTGASLRLRMAPLSQGSKLIGTFLGTWGILFVLSTLVYLASRFLLSASYALSLPWVLALIGAEAFLACAIGIALPLLLGGERKANPIISTAVPLLCFLGGSYTMIPPQGLLFELARISPVRWVNLALLPDALRAITAGPLSGDAHAFLVPAFLSCLIPACAFLAAATLLPRRSR